MLKARGGCVPLRCRIGDNCTDSSSARNATFLSSSRLPTAIARIRPLMPGAGAGRPGVATVAEPKLPSMSMSTSGAELAGQPAPPIAIWASGATAVSPSPNKVSDEEVLGVALSSLQPACELSGSQRRFGPRHRQMRRGLPTEQVSITYPDSVTSMGLLADYGIAVAVREYHGKVFHTDELHALVTRYGFLRGNGRISLTSRDPHFDECLLEGRFRQSSPRGVRQSLVHLDRMRR